MICESHHQTHAHSSSGPPPLHTVSYFRTNPRCCPQTGAQQRIPSPRSQPKPLIESTLARFRTNLKHKVAPQNCCPPVNHACTTWLAAAFRYRPAPSRVCKPSHERLLHSAWLAELTMHALPLPWQRLDFETRLAEHETARQASHLGPFSSSSSYICVSGANLLRGLRPRHWLNWIATHAIFHACAISNPHSTFTVARPRSHVETALCVAIIGRLNRTTETW